MHFKHKKEILFFFFLNHCIIDVVTLGGASNLCRTPELLWETKCLLTQDSENRGCHHSSFGTPVHSADLICL